MYCSILDISYANDLAVGNINLSNGKKVSNNAYFVNTNNDIGMSEGMLIKWLEPLGALSKSPNLLMRGLSFKCQRSLCYSGRYVVKEMFSTFRHKYNDEEFSCDIIMIERASFLWKIPQFPVLTLEFNSVTFQGDNLQLCDGVVQTCELSKICACKFKCLSHCEIDISGKRYTVLWKLEKVNETQGNADVHIPANEDASENDEPIETTHCLPFKVLGTCHSTCRQSALEEAFSYLEEYNRPVFAKIEAEPENMHDKHAIAVYIMSSEDYEKVGYIPSELTKYIHPILKDPDLEVTVNRIRFCTTFQRIGFYLTIDITRKGLWYNAVVKASKNVR